MSDISLLSTSELLSRATTTSNGTSVISSGTSASSSLLGYTSNGTSVVTGTEENKDMFLQLLVAQMSNLDPFSDNSDPTQYITQLAQFSVLEELQTVTSAIDTLASIGNGLLINSALSTSSELLGKRGEFIVDTSTDETVEGTIESVFVDSGIVYMEVRLDDGTLSPFKYEAFLKATI
jgi:flagellar basal-body rod modification protein FlgD